MASVPWYRGKQKDSVTEKFLSYLDFDCLKLANAHCVDLADSTTRWRFRASRAR